MTKWKLVNADGLSEWHMDRLDVAAAFRGDGIEAVEGWIAARHRRAFDREVGRLVAAGVGKNELEDSARHLGVYEVVEGTPTVKGWDIDHGFRESGGRLVAFAPDDGHEAAFAARLGLPVHARPLTEIHEMLVAEVPKRGVETHAGRCLRLAAMGLGSSREARRIADLRGDGPVARQDEEADVASRLASCPMPLDGIARKAWDWAVGTGRERAPGGPQAELGWVRLTTPEELDRESELMSHCVGNGGYDEGVKSGRTQVWSLRDEAGTPWATAEIRDGSLWQFKGPRNAKPIADCYRCLPSLETARGGPLDATWYDPGLAGWVPARLPDGTKAWIDLKNPATAEIPSANLGDRLPPEGYEGLKLHFPKHVRIDDLRLTTGGVLPETIHCNEVWLRGTTPEENREAVSRSLSGRWNCNLLTAEPQSLAVRAARRLMAGAADVEDLRSAIISTRLTDGGTGPLELPLKDLTVRLGTLLSGDEGLLAKVAEGFTWAVQGMAFKASATTLPEVKAVASLVGTAALACLSAKDPEEIKGLMDSAIWQPVASMVVTALKAGVTDAVVVASHPAIQSKLPAETAALAEKALFAYAATPEGRSRLTGLAMAVGGESPRWAMGIERVVAEAAPPRRGIGKGPMEAASRAAAMAGRGKGVGFSI